MIKRSISDKVKSLAKQYPVITITGPRQSGKSTLCKMLFPDKEYVSLEDVDERSMALKDPRQFLGRFRDGAVIDEIQRVPDLLSYIQTIVDSRNKEGMFILTGSQQFDLLQHISQSLAGRTAIVRLLPFTLNEAYVDPGKTRLEKVLFTGFYPRIFDKKLNPSEALSFYVNTYVERDLRMLVNVKDISKFEIFLKLCAGRVGQLLNYTSLGNECGASHVTVKSWISILETSYIIKLLRPYYKNYNKRLVKSPKLYFIDTGLACFLLDIQNESHILNHPLKGSIFENFIIMEILKRRFNQVKIDNLYYYRDNTGNEVDLILDNGTTVNQFEIKAGQTINDDFFKGLTFFSNLSKQVINSYLLYGGEKSYKYKNVNCISWKEINKIEV
jgi:uncharacterized protein